MSLMSELSDLESAGLIQVAQVEPDLQYLFRHTLVQDAAYTSLLTGDRRRLHRAVGQAIEHLYPDHLDEYAPLLARHFERAGEAQRALSYFRRAGDTALSGYANQEAESLYRCGLELDPGSTAGQKGHLLGGLGEALYRQGRYDQALESWQEAIRVYQRTGDLDAVSHMYARAGRAASYALGFPQSLALCLEGLEAVAGAPESREGARLLHETARAYHFSGRSAEAERLCRQALEMAQRCSAPNMQAEALATLGILPQLAGEEAIAALRQAVELAKSADLLEVAERAHHNLAANLFVVAADLEGAFQHFVQAGDLARRRGAAHQEILSLCPAMEILLDRGPAGEIEALLSRLRELLGPTPDNPRFIAIQATLLERQGEWQDALELRRAFYQEAKRRGSHEMMYETASVLAWLLLEMDRLEEFPSAQDREQARAEIEAVLTEVIGLDPGTLGGGIRAPCQLAVLRARQGRVDEARSILDQAPAQVGDKGLTWQKMMLREAAGWIAATEKQWREAIAAFEQAATESKRLGVRWHWARQSLLQAETLMARGRPADVDHARTLLRKARDTFRDLAAPYYVALAARRLEETRSRTHNHAAALTQASRELAVAARVQAGLLPRETPYLPGWQIAAALEPAHQTWGDFYDFVWLEDGGLALVVADVADKGAGAALYMALVRTLLRTYARVDPRHPAAVLEAVNGRLLAETDTDMFVTVLYAVLDADRGEIAYANAGHNPPYLLRAGDQGEAEPLAGTGMALGVVADAAWREEEIRLEAGDTLILYTDGAIDARSKEGHRFGSRRLQSTAQAHMGDLAGEMVGAILAELHAFIGDEARFDDVTLMVVART